LQLSLQANLRGRVILASSGANELSYESQRLGGSPFAHFLATGLRGSADDGDGKISLAELYAYLYSRTVAASLGGSSGPQHPEHGGWFRGAGEWWLTQKIRGTGDLLLRDERLGRCWVLDERERRVLAELRASDPGAVALPPATYRIKCKNSHHVVATTLTLAAGRTYVESLPFDVTSEELVLARGPVEPARSSVGVSAGAHFDPTLDATVVASFRHERHGLGVGASAGLLGTDALVAQAEVVGELPWWSSPSLSLQVGWLVGVESRFDGSGASLALGPLVELSTPLSPWLRLSLRQEMTRTIPLDDGGEPTLPLVTRAGAAIVF
jgi:hypothetical protein